MRGGEAAFEPHAGVPAIGDPGERGIEPRPQRLHRIGQRIGEIAIFAAAEAVPRHDHLAAEMFGGVVEGGDVLAGDGVEQAGQYCPAVGVERVGGGGPVDVVGHGAGLERGVARGAPLLALEVGRGVGC